MRIRSVIGRIIASNRHVGYSHASPASSLPMSDITLLKVTFHFALEKTSNASFGIDAITVSSYGSERSFEHVDARAGRGKVHRVALEESSLALLKHH